MKLSSLSCQAFLAFATTVLGAPALFAQDTTPPVVVKVIEDVTVSVNSAPTVINIKKAFGLQGVVSSNIVRFATSEGNVDVELLANAAPASVANFLSYANAGSYNGSFLHRSVPNFVVQGGGYFVSNGNIDAITENAPVAGEHSLANTRGTLAYALSTGPDSGTDQWFFNLADNSNLDDTSDGGPFTVFGKVTVNGMSVVDAIAGLKIVDASGGDPRSPFNEVPVLPTYSSGTIQLTDLVYVNSVTSLPLLPPTPGAPSALAVKAKTNNPALVTATIKGKKLTLTYAAGQTGAAVIKLIAVDTAGSRVKTKFKVTVQ